MLIKSLKLANGSSTIRKIDFKSGPNFVIDAEDSANHNKVGKTTFLKLIDILLGAKDRKALYYNNETKSTNAELERIIKSEKIFVEGVFGTSFSSEDNQEYILHVDLFSRGKYYINGVKKTQPQFWSELQTIFFGTTRKKPSFRQLIGLFVRVSDIDENNTFLNIIPRGSNAEYRLAYEFIFGISSGTLTLEYEEIRSRYESLKRSQKDYLRLRDNRDLNAEQQVLRTLEERQESYKKQLDELTNQEVFVASREQAFQVRKEYDRILSETSEAVYELEGVTELIQRLTHDLEHERNAELYQDFYEEISTLIPQVHRTFEEMMEFNFTLFQNRLAGLEVAKTSLEERIQKNRAIKNDLLRQDESLALMLNNDLAEYEELVSELSRNEQLIGSSIEAINNLRLFQEQIDALKDELDQIKKTEDNKSEAFSKELLEFNKYFSKYAKQINGEDPILTSTSDIKSFPLSINQLTRTSTGTRKSLTAAFDLALQSYLAESSRTYPKFVVHDVVESVEGKHLKSIFDIAKGIECQYIVAVLNEKLESSGLSNEEIEEAKILVLAEDDLLFEPKSPATTPK